MNEDLLFAAKSGDLEKFVSLHARGADLNYCNQYQMNSLILAAKYGHLAIVNKILSLNINLVNFRDKDRETPLFHASIKGHASIVKTLIKHGASVNVANLDCETPLYHAAWHGHLEIVKILLENDADPDITDNHHAASPILMASTSGYLEIVRELIKWGAEVDPRIVFWHTGTALWNAAKNGHLDIIILLIEHGAQINLKAHDQTPYEIAVKNNHKQTARFLESLEFLVNQYRADTTGYLQKAVNDLTDVLCMPTFATPFWRELNGKTIEPIKKQVFKNQAKILYLNFINDPQLKHLAIVYLEPLITYLCTFDLFGKQFPEDISNIIFNYGWPQAPTCKNLIDYCQSEINEKPIGNEKPKQLSTEICRIS